MRTHLRRHSKCEKRDVLPIFRWLRDRALGRKTETGIRFEWEISERTQPQPNLPDGPSHKLYGNYYAFRDPRRLIEQPKLICGPDEFKRLPYPRSSEAGLTKGIKAGVRPGPVYNPSFSFGAPIRDPAKLDGLNEEAKKKKK